MDDIEDLLLELEKELHEGKKTLFGSGVTVNTEVVFSVIDRIREALPDVIRQARAIVATKEMHMQEETQRAQSLMHNAQQRADELLSEHSIIKQAQREADAIKSQALDYQKHIYAEMRNDVAILLADTETALTESLRIIKNAQKSTR